MNKQQWRSMAVLFMVLFLVMVGFGIIIPVLPFLILDYGGGSTTMGLLMAAYSLTQFIFSPYWGRLSDRIGRRPVLIIGLSGFGVSFIAFSLATQLWMLFIARLLAGAISSAALPTAMAYVADITGEKHRAQGMGMMGAAMGLGMIFGPALGGWLGHFGLMVPFYAAGLLAVLTLPFAYLLLPESLPKSDRTASVDKKLSINVMDDPLLPMLGLAFAVSFSMALFESTFSIFAADHLGFSPANLGSLFTMLGIVGVIIQMWIIGPLSNRYGEARLIVVGIIISAGGLLLILLSSDTVSMMMYTAVFSFGNSLLRPSISTLISKEAGSAQGASIGKMQSFDSLGRIIGPVLGGVAYDISYNLPNILGAAILLAIYVLAKSHLNKYVEERLS